MLSCPGSAGLELAAGKDGKAVDSQQGHYEVRQPSLLDRNRFCPHIHVQRTGPGLRLKAHMCVPTACRCTRGTPAPTSPAASPSTSATRCRRILMGC